MALSTLPRTAPSVSVPRLRTLSSVSILLSLALYVLLFSNMSDFGGTSQMIAVALVLAAAARVLIFGGRGLKRATAAEKVFYLLSLSSLFFSFLNILFIGSEYIYSFIYSLLLGVVIFSLSIAISKLDELALVNAAVYAYFGILVTTVVREYVPFAAALAFGSADRWMLRFSPFEMHPNLVGFVFSGGAIILLYKSAMAKGAMRYLAAIGAVTALAVVLAASARASLLAFLLSSGFVFLVYFNKLNKRLRLTTIVVIFLSIVVAIFYYDLILAYLVEVLELDSSTRGVDSGGSGRTELWIRGINLIFDDVYRAIVGGGLRSASPEIIGFSTESSYITVVLESGLVVGFIFFALLFGLVLKLLPSRRRPLNLLDALFLHLLCFVLLQSFFNRYLLAIGNTLSLFMLMAIVMLSRRSIREVVGVTQNLYSTRTA